MTVYQVIKEMQKKTDLKKRSVILDFNSNTTNRITEFVEQSSQFDDLL